MENAVSVVSNTSSSGVEKMPRQTKGRRRTFGNDGTTISDASGISTLGKIH